MKKGEIIMNNFIVKIENINGILVTTSNRVAEELGVNHKDLLDKIDGYIEKFTKAESSALVEEFCIPSFYTVNGNFKKYRNYLITKKGIAQLVGGYSAAVSKAFELNVAYINEFERMENALKNNKLPQKFSEALMIAAKIQAEKEELEKKNEELKKYEKFVNFKFKTENFVSTKIAAKGFNTTSHKLNLLLEECRILKKVQYKDSDGKNRNCYNLTEKYKNKDYGELKNIRIKNNKCLYWTEKGLALICETLDKNNLLDMEINLFLPEKEKFEIELKKHELVQKRINEKYKKN